MTRAEDTLVARPEADREQSEPDPPVGVHPGCQRHDELEERCGDHPADHGHARLLASQQRDAETRILSEPESVRRQAVDEERARIVRELHDVVGHEVTRMSIQSQAAASAREHAPSRAAGPLAAVRETAHRANRELRSVLVPPSRWPSAGPRTGCRSR